MALIVSRHRNEAVKLLTPVGEIRVWVREGRGKRFRIAIEAPTEIVIVREELLQIDPEQKPAA
jgi:sRNA-binding carbon storage regulator CsrA